MPMPITPMTTLEKYRGARAGNYSTLPTIDVPILPDVKLCAVCREPITHEPGRMIWEHKDGPTGHRAEARSRCRYCHSEDAATYVQHAYFDAVECSRCGGVAGFGIGD